MIDTIVSLIPGGKLGLFLLLVGVLLFLLIIAKIAWKIFAPDADKGVAAIAVQTVLTALWGILPVDPIPDVIPGLGYIDDLAVVILLILQILSWVEQKDQTGRVETS